MSSEIEGVDGELLGESAEQIWVGVRACASTGVAMNENGGRLPRAFCMHLIA
jgi:hypothetical protein